jgi:hypothetical protein
MASPHLLRRRAPRPQVPLKGMTNRHGTREAAAIAGSPLRQLRAPSRARLAGSPRERCAELEVSALPGTPAARILEELYMVVAKSHRRWGLRRLLHSVRSAFAKWCVPL